VTIKNLSKGPIIEKSNAMEKSGLSVSLVGLFVFFRG
jgi:hypothetical protein